MATSTRRTAEKGQRTPRSTATYVMKRGSKGASACACGAVYRQKRWTMETGAASTGNGRICPACRRIAERNPAGIAILSGDYLAAHATEIDNLVRHVASEYQQRNPLGRVMTASREGAGLAITTTDAKLAQKIGREVQQAHGGELSFLWSDGEEPVRVHWRR